MMPLVTNAQRNEPILRFKRFLEHRHLWDDAQEQALIASCAEEIQNEVDIYLNRTAQPLNSIFDYHYETLPSYLIEQRAVAMENDHNA